MKIIKIDPSQLDVEVVREAAPVIQSGGLGSTALFLSYPIRALSNIILRARRLFE